MLIKQVPVETILPLRQRILRSGKSLKKSRFKGDLSPSTFHLALYRAETIVAVATFIKTKTPLLASEHQYRLRGMAVAVEFQKQGFGQALFNEGLRVLNTKNTAYLWLNARKNAVEFYQKQGCQIISDAFDIPGIGTHYTMEKEI